MTMHFLLYLYLLHLLTLNVRPTASSTTTTATKQKGDQDQQIIQLRWYAPFLSGGGYCSEAMAFAQAIVAHVPSVALTVHHHGDTASQAFYRGLTEQEQTMLSTHGVFNDLSSLGVPPAPAPHRPPAHPVADIVVCHSEPGAWDAPTANYHTTACPPTDRAGFGGGGMYVVGRTMFETDRLPDGWAARLAHMDEVWVPTAFMRGIFEAAGVPADKLHVVGEPVDTDFFRPVALADVPRLPAHHARQALDNGKAAEGFYKVLEKKKGATPPTLILFVGKWEERKGVKKLLRAYHTEFKPTENVLLVLLTNAYHSTNQFEKEIAVYLREQGLLGKGPPYTVLTGLPQSLLPSLYSLADVLAIPSHGEGWGRPHVEAMSCGTPAIATAWSGPTAFVTEDNGYPLRVAADLVPTPGWAGHQWADPDETHLRTLLRRVHATPDEARAKGAQAREDMVARFSLQALAAQVDEEVRRIRVSEPYQKKGEGVPAGRRRGRTAGGQQDL